MKIKASMEATLQKINATGIKAGDEVATDLYRAVSAHEDAANTRLNFYEISNRSGISKLVEDIRKAGITEFTVSESSTALMEIINALYQNGCMMTGTTAVYKEFSIDEENPETIPALLFKVC